MTLTAGWKDEDYSYPKPSWRKYKMTLNLSMIDDDKLRKELNDIICHCGDCNLERYDCNCQYRCLFKFVKDFR